MFNKIKEKIKEEIKKVSSWRWKFSIICNLFCWILGSIVFISFTIYWFCYFANTEIWQYGFFLLFFTLIFCIMFGLGFKWLYKRYKLALYYEKEKEKEKEEERKNEIKNN